MTINSLSESNLLTFTDDDRYCFEASAGGRIMSQNCVKFDDMMAIQDTVQAKQEPTIETLLEMAASRICCHVPLRRNDKATLNEMNQSKIQHRLKGATGKYMVQTDAMKANVLLQAALGRIPCEDDYLALEMDECVEMAQRIIRALMEFCMETGVGALGLLAFRLWRSLALKAWEHSPATTKLQLLDGVDCALAQALDASGVHSIRQLRDMDLTQLSRCLKMAPKDCECLVSEAKAILDCRLQVQSYLITSQLEITVRNAQPQQIHVISERPPTGYVLLVLSKGRILLLRRDITNVPTTFMVHIPAGMSSISIHLLHTTQLGMDEEIDVQVSAGDFTFRKAKQTMQQTTIIEAFKAGTHQKAARQHRSQPPSATHHLKRTIAAAPPIAASLSKRVKLSEPSVPQFKQYQWRGSNDVAIAGTSATKAQDRVLHVIPHDDVDLRSQVYGSTSLARPGPFHAHTSAMRTQERSIDKPTTHARLNEALDFRFDGADVHTIPTNDVASENLTLEEEFMKYIF